MTIQIAKGNIIRNDVEALVNTVNCDGYMGKGIALQFKKAFPDNFSAYAKAARNGLIIPGRMFIYEISSLMNPKFIINFPTKRHWQGKSRLEDIESGLRDLVKEVKNRDIKSIAVPPLGCGLGGLNWADVRPMIESAFSKLPEVDVKLYESVGTPLAESMPVGTKRPKMTLARALLVKTMRQYSKLSYRLTLLEIQKLAYFLQEVGEPMQLKYVAHTYGPYAANLNKLLETLEGHFTRGYGDTQKPDVEIHLLEGAIEAADMFLVEHDASNMHLAKVARVVEGFETPYGMELLSSVHWTANKLDNPATTPDEAVRLVHEWNERKQRMFTANHIRIAWQHLRQEGLIPGS